MRGRKDDSNTSEHWTKLIRPMMETDAWRALSSSAQALYPWLKLEWKGPKANNNGKIRLSVRQAAARMGVGLNTANRAFNDLQAKGFIVQTEHARIGIGGAAKSPAYEITELALPQSEKASGRKLYNDWRANRDFLVHRSSPNNPKGRNGKTKSRLQNEDSNVIEMKTKSESTSSK